VLANKSNDQEENLLLQKLKRETDSELVESCSNSEDSGEEAESKAYTLIIVANMAPYQEPLKGWKNLNESMSKHKKIILD
jgi:nitrogenase subunit NifH